MLRSIQIAAALLLALVLAQATWVPRFDRLSNGERLKRGLPPKKPVRLYDPSRTRALLPRASNTPMSVLIAAYSDAAMTNMLGYVYYAPTYGFLGITATSAATFNLPNSGPSTVNTITSPNTNGPDTPYIVAQSEGSYDFANSAYDYDLGYEYSPGHYQWALLSAYSSPDTAWATGGDPTTGPATSMYYNGVETSNWNIPLGGYGPATFTWYNTDGTAASANFYYTARQNGIFVALAANQITDNASTQPIRAYTESDRVYLAYVPITFHIIAMAAVTQGGTARIQTATSALTLGTYLPRPDDGKAGKPIKVFANMFKANVDFKGVVHHYDVQIEPVVRVAGNREAKKSPKPLQWKVWKQAQTEAQGDVKRSLMAGAFDQVQNMYTPIKLANDKKAHGDWDTVHRTGIGTPCTARGLGHRAPHGEFKIVLTLTGPGGTPKPIYMGALVDYCRGTTQAKAAEEMVLSAIQALNVLSAQDCIDKYIPGGAQGRRFFDDRRKDDIGGGANVVHGFYQSMRPTRSGFPAMQIDVAFSPYIKSGPLLAVAAELLGGSRGGGGGRGRGGGFDRGGRGRGGGPMHQSGGPNALDNLDQNGFVKLSKIFLKSKVKVTHRSTDKIYTVVGFTKKPAFDIRFELEGRNGQPNRMVTLPEYFKIQYNLDLRKPRLPCAILGKTTMIPMEFIQVLEINPWPFRMMNPEITSEIIRIATGGGPSQRLGTIRDWRSKLDYNNLPRSKTWGVQINDQMMEVDARVLPPPVVVYGGSQRTQPRNGAWTLKGAKYVIPGEPLKRWAVLSLDRYFDEAAMKQRIPRLTQRLEQSNCRVENSYPFLLHRDPNIGGAQKGIGPAIKEACRMVYTKFGAPPQLLVIIAPKKEAGWYQAVKGFAAEGLPKPIVTQIMAADKLNKDNGLDQYLGNVSMKIHVKLGGVTHVVQQPMIDTKTMIVGVDVTHPPPQGGGLLHPSIAVTVATVDGANQKFVPSYRLQNARVEIIPDFEGTMVTHMSTFKKNTGSAPEKILVFRDGVSEGQYAQVVNEELAAIHRAAHRVDPKYKPKVTFTICGKRASDLTWVSVVDSADDYISIICDSSPELPRIRMARPAISFQVRTVVDTGVTDPYLFDFYLQAHGALQGTARPTHYVVVSDDNKFTADKMQALCNAMSYTYFRATRAVSIVPPAYIICTKLRDLVYIEDSSDASTVVSSSSSARNQTKEYDPLRLEKRLEAHPEFNKVAWVGLALRSLSYM
ncbi:hypothetical protein JCM24511_05492 [Saitozyma sp. JCM 24511]|nr:hypothetical protein JCM24511_05492 [Saitozyma sp. JCM 24511]